jgi:hypothetical protein
MLAASCESQTPKTPHSSLNGIVHEHPGRRSDLAQIKLQCPTLLNESGLVSVNNPVGTRRNFPSVQDFNTRNPGRRVFV